MTANPSIDHRVSNHRSSTIQALRALAALMVMVMHLEGNIAFITGVFPRFFYWFCFSGVDLFFAISGFVMVWAHHGDAGAPGRAWRFIRLRLIRIFPNYWCFAAFAGLLVWLIDYRADAPQMDVPASLLLWPQDTAYHLLPVAWTLSFELLFYFIFALLLCLPARFFPYGLALWAVIIVGAQEWVDYEQHFSWQNFLLSAWHLQFLAGAAAAWCALNTPRTSGIAWLAVGGALWLLAVSLSAYAIDASLLHRTERMWRGILFAVAFGPLLYGVAQLEKRNLRIPAFAVRLGDASYTLYLLHLPLLALWMWGWANLFGTGGSWGSASLYAASYLAACITLSLVHFRCVEKPMTRWLRGMTEKQKG